MGHIRKDSLVGKLEWWKHLRGRKRDQAKAERRAAKVEIRQELGRSPAH